MNLTLLFYAKLRSTFDEPTFSRIEQVYQSLWCKQVLKTGNKCKSRAQTDAEYCKRHSRPRCAYIFTTKERRGLCCGRYAQEDSTFCGMHVKCRARESQIEDIDCDEPVVRKKRVKRAPIAKPAIEPIIEPVVEPAVEYIAEPVVEPAIEPIIEPVVEPAVEHIAEPVVEPAIEPIIEPVVESVVEPAVEHVVEPVVEPAVEHIAEPVVESVVEPAVEHIAEPVVESVVEPAVEHIVEPVVESVVEPAVEHIVEPIIEPVVEPAVEHVVEPVVEPVVELARELAIDEHYVMNKVSLLEDYPSVPHITSGCLVKFQTGARIGQPCGRVCKTNYRCGAHKNHPIDVPDPEKYIPRHVWVKGPFWDNLLKNYNWRALADTVQTQSLMVYEIDRDDDSIINEADANPRFRPHICYYPDLTGVKYGYIDVCNEDVEEGHYYCSKHKRADKKFRHECTDPHDSLWWVFRPLPERSCGMWHFRRLRLYAWLTRRGFIAVGKLWNGAYPEQLTLCNLSRERSYARALPDDEIVDQYGGHAFSSEEEAEKFKRRYKYTNDELEGEDEHTYILRCHNNGLLYKLIPQEYLLYNYDLSDLDKLPGKGFVSFEQMIRDRPSLYIKYWNVWNGQIRRAKDWILCKGNTLEELHEKYGLLSPVYWERFHSEAFMAGLFNVVIPAPELTQVQQADFNPFLYCERWVLENCPDQIERPHFPPMYILYPFPDEEYQRKQKKLFERTVRTIALQNRKMVQHYHYSTKTENPYTWLQWIKFGTANNLFPGTSLDVPPRLVERLGFTQFDPIEFPRRRED